MVSLQASGRDLPALRRSFKLSKSLLSVLSAITLQEASVGSVAAVAGFINAAASLNIKGESAARVAQALFGSGQPADALHKLLENEPSASRMADSAQVSSGLWQAFEEARAIRSATGGKDPFLGLRHVLFAIFRASQPPLTDEVAELLSYAGIDRSTAIRMIADYCIRFREPNELVEVWRDILQPIGLLDIVDSAQAGDTADPSGLPKDEPFVGTTQSFVDTGLVGDHDLGESEVLDVTPPSPIVAPRPTDDPDPRDTTGGGVALLNADDPWAPNVQDRTGAKDEADAFAAMIMARQFQPPLAVGVFGDWGSGKSFFLRLIHDAIEARRERLQRASSPVGVAFYRNIVPIRFNAWHYAETNIWASLVDQIFTSLNRWAETKASPSIADKLFDRLATAQKLTVESAEILVQRRRERAEATIKLNSAEYQLAERRKVVERTPASYASAALKVVTAGLGVKDKLNEAAKNLGFDKLSEKAEDFNAAAMTLDEEVTRYAFFRSGLLRSAASPVVVGFVAISTLTIPPILVAVVAVWQKPAAEFAATIPGLVAPLALAFGWAAQRTNAAVAVIRDFRRAFNAEVEKLTSADQATLLSANRDLATAEAAVNEASERLRLANERAAEAARDYNGESGRERALRFVRERIADGDYAKHLTFVATVRKDFEKLSQLMTAEPPAPTNAETMLSNYHKQVNKFIENNAELLTENEKTKLEEAFTSAPAPPVFERIVLYIDDLDRCPSDQVVTVLQAIHLLLTFPLFVVFVAVDVRWLRESLVRSYPGQLEQIVGKDRATPTDYLEKIFQIPYWVRPMGVESTQAILKDQWDIDEAASVRHMPDNEVKPSPRPAEPDEAEGGSFETVTPLPEPLWMEPHPSGSSTTQLLKFTQPKRDFMRAMAVALDGLPRRTLRFINTYRLIKGSLGEDELVYLERGGFKALTTLLAIGITADDDFPAIARLLRRGLGEDGPLQAEKVLAQAKIKRPATRARVQQALQLAEGASVSDFARYATLSARFSFHDGLENSGSPEPSGVDHKMEAHDGQPSVAAA
jgi:hypothetical protein